MPGLAPDVRDWEPHLALTPGGDGLDAYRAIIRAAPSRLMIGGRLIVEIGPTQAAEVAGMMTEHNFADIRVLQDLDGRDRVICGRKQENIAV
jgi:release factor glutamine methyltransferase